MRTLLRLARVVVAAIALIPVLFLLWPAFDGLGNEVTVYPLFRSTDGEWFPANRTVYKVFPETQTVVHWTPGVSEVPDRLSKCSVRDRNNWRCEYSDGSGVLVMEGGVFSEESRPGGPPSHFREGDFMYTGRLNWWRLYLR